MYIQNILPYIYYIHVYNVCILLFSIHFHNYHMLFFSTEVNAGVYRGYQVAVKTIFDKKDESPEMQNFIQEAAILT